MKSIFNKANAPYFVGGSLATSAFLVSGVFAIAPYIVFLAPVAALSVGLPLIIVGAVFSVVAIALSCAAISKNNTIHEKNKVIDQKTKEIKCKDKLISRKQGELNQTNIEISSLKEKLSNKKAEVQAQKQKISEKNDQITQTEEEMNVQAALKKALTSTKEAFTSGRATPIIKDGLKDAYSAMPSANSIKEIFGSVYDKSVEYTKGAPNSVKNGLKSIMPSVDSVHNWIPSLKTVAYIAGGAGGAGLTSVATYAATNGLVATDTLPNAVNPIAKDLGNHTLSSSSRHIPVSLQVIMENKTNEYSKKLANAEKWYNDQCGITEKGNVSHKDDEPQWHKNLYKSESLEEIIDGGTLDNLFCQVDNGTGMPRQQGTIIIDSAENIQAALGKALISTKEAFTSGHVTRIAKNFLKDVCDPISSIKLIPNWIFSPKTVGYDSRSFTKKNDNYKPSKTNMADSTHTKVSSETVDTAVVTYSNTSETCPANYETSLARYDSTDTCSSQDVCLNKNGNIWSYISKFIPFGSHRSSKTDVATYSNTDASGTCPANYETSLAKYDSTDTCHSDNQFAKSDITQVESGKAISESNSSNVVPFCTKVSNDIDTSKSQGTLVNSVELKRLTREVHPSRL